DKHGVTRPIEPKDIFVIAPYNAQVRELRQRIRGSAVARAAGITDELLRSKVGTVDKAQGAEAPVVLMSYTSSSAADIPRNFEFLYDKNRLNVAVSRAQALAVVVASPQLLSVECKTIDQVKLANMLCRYAEMAELVTL
ncbi:MAG: AAA domain-containing protein, partial [Actinomycetota bacterium]